MFNLQKASKENLKEEEELINWKWVAKCETLFVFDNSDTVVEHDCAKFNLMLGNLLSIAP